MSGVDIGMAGVVLHPAIMVVVAVVGREHRCGGAAVDAQLLSLVHLRVQRLAQFTRRLHTVNLSVVAVAAVLQWERSRHDKEKSGWRGR